MRAVWIAGAALLLASLSTAAAASDRAPLGKWIDRYEALRCEPHRIIVASRAPLSFAVLGECAGVPKAQRGPSTRQLVTVDTATNMVVSVGLGYGYVWNSVYADSDGDWRWLSLAGSTYPPRERLDIQELAQGQRQPRSIATSSISGLEGPIGPGALRGDNCWLFNRARFKDRDMRELTGFDLVSAEGNELRMRAVEGLRGVRFWHPAEHAFVVQPLDTSFALLACDGTRRELAESDLAWREARDNIRIRISPRGDWLFSDSSGLDDFTDHHDRITVYSGAQTLTFGPFQQADDDFCPDVCATETAPLMNPEWSDSGDFILVQGLLSNYVLRASDLSLVRKWREGSGFGEAVLLSDSLAMDLTKNRGVKFYRW